MFLSSLNTSWDPIADMDVEADVVWGLMEMLTLAMIEEKSPLSLLKRACHVSKLTLNLLSGFFVVWALSTYANNIISAGSIMLSSFGRTRDA